MQGGDGRERYVALIEKHIEELNQLLMELRRPTELPLYNCVFNATQANHDLILIASTMGVSIEAIRSGRKDAQRAAARAIATYCLRTKYGRTLSYPQLASLVGLTCHTTVLKHMANIRALIADKNEGIIEVLGTIGDKIGVPKEKMLKIAK